MHSENWQALNSLQKRYRGKVKCIYIDPPFNLDGSDQFDYRTNYKDSCWATMLENRIALARDFLGHEGKIFVRCDYHGNWIVRGLLNFVFGDVNFRNEIIVKKSGIAQSLMYNRFNPSVESLFLYGKSQEAKIIPQTTKRSADRIKWMDMHIHKENRNANSVVYNGETFVAPQTRHLPSQDLVDKLTSENRIRVVEKRYVDVHGASRVRMLQYLMKDYDIVENDWLDIAGYSPSSEFPTENSEALLHRVTMSATNDGHCMFDFFAGSGTTQAVAQKLGRKWLGVEMGEHFHKVVLPRLKNVLYGQRTGISKDVKHKGGGFFKYYSLEQYEQTLKNARYNPGQHLELDSAKSPFAQYAFFGDDKLAYIVTVKNDKLQIDLHKLYADIDIAESLANILGKTIRKRTAESVTFADGSAEKINPATMTEDEKRHFVALIKPYLWWGN